MTQHSATATVAPPTLLPYAYEQQHHVLPIYCPAARARIHVAYTRDNIYVNVADLAKALRLDFTGLTTAVPVEYYRGLPDGTLDTYYSYGTTQAVINSYAAAESKQALQSFITTNKRVATNWPAFLLSAKTPQ